MTSEIDIEVAREVINDLYVTFSRKLSEERSKTLKDKNIDKIEVLENFTKELFYTRRSLLNSTSNRLTINKALYVYGTLLRRRNEHI